MGNRKPGKKGMAKLRQGLSQLAPQIKEHIESVQRAEEKSPTIEDYEKIGGNLDSLKGDALWAYLDEQSKHKKRYLQHSTAELQEITARISERLNASGFLAALEVTDLRQERETTFFRIVAECKGKKMEVQENIVEYIDLHLAKAKHQHEVMKEVEQWFKDLLSEQQLEKEFAQEVSGIKLRHIEAEYGHRSIMDLLARIDDVAMKLKDIGGVLSLSSSTGIKIIDGPSLKEDQITLLVPTESEKEMSFQFTVYLDDEMMFNDPKIQNMAQQYLKGLIFYGSAAKHKNRAEKRKIIRLTMRQLDAFYNFIARLRVAMNHCEQEASALKTRISNQHLQLEQMFREKEMYRIQNGEIQEAVKKLVAEKEVWLVDKVLLEDAVKQAIHETAHAKDDCKDRARSIFDEEEDDKTDELSQTKEAVSKMAEQANESDSSIISSKSASARNIIDANGVERAHKEIQVYIDDQVKINPVSREIQTESSLTSVKKADVGAQYSFISSPAIQKQEFEEIKDEFTIKSEEVEELAGELKKARPFVNELKSKSPIPAKVLPKTETENVQEKITIEKLQTELNQVGHDKDQLEAEVEALKTDIKTSDTVINKLTTVVNTQAAPIISDNASNARTFMENDELGETKTVPTKYLTTPDAMNELQNLKAQLGMFKTSMINVLVDQNLIVDIPPFSEKLQDTWNVNTAAQEIAQDVATYFPRLANIVKSGFSKMKNDHEIVFQHAVQKKVNSVESTVPDTNSNQELRKERIKLQQKVLNLENENAQMHENMKSMTKLLEERQQDFHAQMKERDHNFTKLLEDRNNIKELTWTLAEALAKLRDEAISKLPERKSILDMMQLLQTIEQRIGEKVKPTLEKKKTAQQMGVQGASVNNHGSSVLKISSKGPLSVKMKNNKSATVEASTARDSGGENGRSSLIIDQRTSPPNFAIPDQSAKYLARADGAHKVWLEYTYYSFDPVYERITLTTREIEQDNKSVQTDRQQQRPLDIDSDLDTEPLFNISSTLCQPTLFQMHLSSVPVPDSQGLSSFAKKESVEPGLPTGMRDKLEKSRSGSSTLSIESRQWTEAHPTASDRAQVADSKDLRGLSRIEPLTAKQLEGSSNGQGAQPPTDQMEVVPEQTPRLSLHSEPEPSKNLVIPGTTVISKPTPMVRPVGNSQRLTTLGLVAQEQPQKSSPPPQTPHSAGQMYVPKAVPDFISGTQVADPMSQQGLHLTSQQIPTVDITRKPTPFANGKLDVNKLTISGQSSVDKLTVDSVVKKGPDKSPPSLRAIKSSQTRSMVDDSCHRSGFDNPKGKPGKNSRLRPAAEALCTQQLATMSLYEHIEATIELLSSVEEDLENQVDGIRKSITRRSMQLPTGFTQYPDGVTDSGTTSLGALILESGIRYDSSNHGVRHNQKALKRMPGTSAGISKPPTAISRNITGHLSQTTEANNLRSGAQQGLKLINTCVQDSKQIQTQFAPMEELQPGEPMQAIGRSRSNLANGGLSDSPTGSGVLGNQIQQRSGLGLKSFTDNLKNVSNEFVSDAHHQPNNTASAVVDQRHSSTLLKARSTPTALDQSRATPTDVSQSLPEQRVYDSTGMQICSPDKELREEQLLQELSKIRQAQTHLAHVRSHFASLEVDTAAKRVILEVPDDRGISTDEQSDTDEPSRRKLQGDRTFEDMSKGSLEALHREAMLIKKDIKTLVQGHRAASRRTSQGSPDDSLRSSQARKGLVTSSLNWALNSQKKKVADEREQKIFDAQVSRKKKMSGLDMVIIKSIQHGPAWQKAQKSFYAPPVRDLLPNMFNTMQPFSLAVVGGGVDTVHTTNNNLLRGFNINVPRAESVFSHYQEVTAHQIRVPKTKARRGSPTLAEMREDSITNKLKFLHDQREAQGPKHVEKKMSNPLLRTHRGEEMLEGPVDLMPHDFAKMGVIGRPIQHRSAETRPKWYSDLSVAKCDNTDGRTEEGAPAPEIRAASPLAISKTLPERPQ